MNDWLRLALPLLLGLLLGSHPVPAQESPASRPPLIRVEAEIGLEATARELLARPDQRTLALARFVGLDDPGDPILVHLATEDSTLARRTPAWISGFAVVERGVTVLFPARVPTYPYDSLQELLDHELLHVFLYRSVGDRPLPRWFSEGISLVGSRGLSLTDRGQALVGGVRGGPGDVDDLESYFSGDRRHSHTAYALSGAFLHDLIRRHGSDWIPSLARGMRSGASFGQAFGFATDEDLDSAEARFFRRSRLLYTWLPWFSSGAGLWLLVTALALVAGRRSRQRTAAIEARWAEEDAFRRSPLELVPRESEDTPRTAVSEDPIDGSETSSASTDEPSKEWIH